MSSVDSELLVRLNRDTLYVETRKNCTYLVIYCAIKLQKLKRKIEKLYGVLDNQNFYSNLMFFKVVVFMKKVRKITFFFK